MSLTAKAPWTTTNKSCQIYLRRKMRFFRKRKINWISSIQGSRVGNNIFDWRTALKKVTSNQFKFWSRHIKLIRMVTFTRQRLSCHQVMHSPFWMTLLTKWIQVRSNKSCPWLHSNKFKRNTQLTFNMIYFFQRRSVDGWCQIKNKERMSRLLCKLENRVSFSFTLTNRIQLL